MEPDPLDAFVRPLDGNASHRLILSTGLVRYVDSHTHTVSYRSFNAVNNDTNMQIDLSSLSACLQKILARRKDAARVLAIYSTWQFPILSGA
jgi:hypothetical protein